MCYGVVIDDVLWGWYRDVWWGRGREREEVIRCDWPEGLDPPPDSIVPPPYLQFQFVETKN